MDFLAEIKVKKGIKMKPDNTFSVLAAEEKEYFNLIPQTGVTHLLCEDMPTHNAVWDMLVTPEGRVFFSACGESYVAEYARLMEYDHKNKKIIKHFNLEDKIILRENTLRTSKFHTALSVMNDGRLITTTHTPPTYTPRRRHLLESALHALPLTRHTV